MTQCENQNRKSNILAPFQFSRLAELAKQQHEYLISIFKFYNFSFPNGAGSQKN